MDNYETTDSRVWARMALEHPEFTRDHNALSDPYALEYLLFGDQIKLGPFKGNVMDIGANAGILTAYWALNGATVTAYEADPTTFKILQDMIARTGLPVTVIHAAVWKDSGAIRFRGGSCIDQNRMIRGGCLWVKERPDGFYEDPDAPIVTVPCVSFKDALGDKEWDCVKMDIEGSEFEVLMSTPIESLRQIKQLQLEFHHWWASDELYSDLIFKLITVFRIEGQEVWQLGDEFPGRYKWAVLERK